VKVAPLLVPALVVTVTVRAPVAADALTVNVAVIWLALTTLTPDTETPEPLALMEAPAAKFVPASVTGTLAFCAPLDGVIEVRVTPWLLAFTVNVAALLVPAVVLTVTLREPVAAEVVIVKVAVIWLEFTTLTLLTVTPEPLTLTVSPEAKLAPAKVTFTAAPSVPLGGVTEVSVGPELLAATVNVTALLVPAEVVTVTLREPVAAEVPMVNVAVIWPALTTVTLLTVIPEPLAATVAPAARLAPARVMFTAAPCVPLAGVTDVKVGAEDEIGPKTATLLVVPT
jgi:hypothetical protein